MIETLSVTQILAVFIGDMQLDSIGEGRGVGTRGSPDRLAEVDPALYVAGPAFRIGTCTECARGVLAFTSDLHAPYARAEFED